MQHAWPLLSMVTMQVGAEAMQKLAKIALTIYGVI